MNHSCVHVTHLHLHSQWNLLQSSPALHLGEQAWLMWLCIIWIMPFMEMYRGDDILMGFGITQQHLFYNHTLSSLSPSLCLSVSWVLAHCANITYFITTSSSMFFFLTQNRLVIKQSVIPMNGWEEGKRGGSKKARAESDWSLLSRARRSKSRTEGWFGGVFEIAVCKSQNQYFSGEKESCWVAFFMWSDWWIIYLVIKIWSADCECEMRLPVVPLKHQILLVLTSPGPGTALTRI